MEENLPVSSITNKKYVLNKEVKSEHQEQMRKIGLKLIQLRTDKNISASRLTKDLGISRNAYYAMESGKVYFNILNLILVLDYHHVTISEFFSGL